MKFKLTKSLMVILFGVGWFIYQLIKYHKFDWLVPIVFIIIGLYLRGKE